jgi:Spy/CpxP family protein refolding chaperone
MAFADPDASQPGPQWVGMIKQWSQALGLSDTQQDQIKTIVAADSAKASAIRADATLTRADKIAQIKDLRIDCRIQTMQVLTPEQREKTFAMSGDQLKKELELTADQQTKLDAIFADAHADTEKIIADGSLTPEQRMAALKQRHETTHAQLAQILTPDQLADLKDMREAANTDSVLAGADATPSAGNFAGTRFRCDASQKVALQYGGNTYPTDAIEAADSLLVPVRAFSLVGAEVKWDGEQRVTVTLGSRVVALTFGEHTARIIEGGKTTDVSWDLCPRQHSDTAYVPLRPMAEALGFVVTWSPGVAKLDVGGN